MIVGCEYGGDNGFRFGSFGFPEDFGEFLRHQRHGRRSGASRGLLATRIIVVVVVRLGGHIIDLWCAVLLLGEFLFALLELGHRFEAGSDTCVNNLYEWVV